MRIAAVGPGTSTLRLKGLEARKKIAQVRRSETSAASGSTNKMNRGKASDGIAAHLMKYPSEVHVLCVVYDPRRAIPDDDKFCSDFAKKRPCTIFIVR